MFKKMNQCKKKRINLEKEEPILNKKKPTRCRDPMASTPVLSCPQPKNLSTVENLILSRKQKTTGCPKKRRK